MEASISIEVIYEEYYARSYNLVRSIVRSDSIAEDIVADSMITLWNTMQKDAITTTPLGFLFTTLKNNSLNYLERVKTRKRILEKIQQYEIDDINYRISSLDALKPTDLLSKEVQEIITQTLSVLPAKTAQALWMSKFDNKSAKDIASALGISVKGVEYHITKAIKQLRIELQDYLTVLILLNLL